MIRILDNVKGTPEPVESVKFGRKLVETFYTLSHLIVKSSLLYKEILLLQFRYLNSTLPITRYYLKVVLTKQMMMMMKAGKCLMMKDGRIRIPGEITFD